MTFRTSKHRLTAAGARAGFAVSSLAFLASLVAAGASHPAPAAAATAGEAMIINPVEAGGGPLSGGGGDTDFSLSLPTGASCTGDATANYMVYGYMVAASIDPNTLTFDSLGPVGQSYGAPQGSFRAPLYETTSAGYVAKFPAAADQPGGPGLIVNIPAFDFLVLQPEGGSALVLPGDYNIGIACWRAGTGAVLDRYWNATISVVADPGDPSPVDIAWTASAPATATAVSLATDPAGSVAPGAEVTLTATVEPASAQGTVTFRDATDDLGAPVAVSGGSASLATADLADGDHVLTAAFVPADGSGFAASTSADVVLTVSQTAPSSTTTTAVGGTSTTVPGSTPTTVAAAGGVSSGSPLGALARTGASLSMVVWGGLMLVFGRMAILLGRKPTIRPARPG